MIIILKKIRKDSFDDLLDRCQKEFLTSPKGIKISKDEIEAISDEVIFRGSKIELDINLDKYEKLITSNNDSNVKKAIISKYLYEDFSQLISDGIPFNLIFDEKIWAYLNLVYFRKMIFDLLFWDDQDKYANSRIERYYFNISSRQYFDRTSFRFYWFWGNVFEGDEKLLRVANEFIDSVKAVFEHQMGRNNNLMKAYVEGIIKNNSNPLLKNDIYRKLVPKNFNSYAAIVSLDGMSYDDLVNETYQLQKSLLKLNLKPKKKDKVEPV